MQKVLSMIPSILLAISSVSMCITAFINYLSCDSCKAKRQAKLEKIKLKVIEEINKKNEN